MDKTDDFVTYNIVVQMGHKHKLEVIKGKKVDDGMKWIYILISNAKAFIMDTFPGIGKKHLQVYLDGFFCRLNHRDWELQLFVRLVTVCVNSQGVCYAELIK